MAVQPRYIKHEETLKPSSSDQSPVVTLLYLSGQGIVFKSRCLFETGTKLAIGLHLDKIRSDLGVAEHLFELNPFVNIQGFVADCKLVETSAIGSAYQVTLLFDQLGDSDQMMVDSIEREVKLQNQHELGVVNAAAAPPLPAHRGSGLN